MQKESFLKTTPSVIIRIILWAMLLIGGAWWSVHNDLHCFKPLFSSPLFHVVTLAFGLLLMKLTFHAAAVGGRELARHGREGAIPRLETNRLVTTGIYSCTRHPMLFGLAFIPLALGLILGSPTFILLTAPLEMVFIFLMVWTVEERECRSKFGAAYDDYADDVPLFPKSLACLKRLFLSQKR